MVFKKNVMLTGIILFLVLFVITSISHAQIRPGQQLMYSQQFRLGERLIRVAEPGELVDTVSVWGDVNSPGRYIIPQSATLPELISYAFGPQTIRDRESNLDWSKMRVEVSVSNYTPQTGQEEVTNYRYKFNEPMPDGMRTFELETDQIVSIQVKRKPAFIDYVRVIAPVISSVATTILIVERLR